MAAYRGIKFPFSKSEGAFPAGSQDEDLIKESLIQLLTTAKGERVMRPDVGSKLLSFIFENVGSAMDQLVGLEIRSVIAKYETRVIVTSIDLTRTDTTTSVDVNYILASTGATGTLSVPLPVSPG